uniref:Putative salivary secreted protein n=1 Tax=Culex tarsalis TaxID=7177 RepID=A0A1Q3FYC8_CULTA
MIRRLLANILLILILIKCKTSAEDSQCTTEADIENIKQVLVNLQKSQEQTVNYSVDKEDASCKRHLQQIKVGLTKLTHQRKMMAKRYVTEDRYKELVQEYDKELKELERSFEEQKQYSLSSMKDNLAHLVEDAEKLRKTEKELNSQLRTWDIKNDGLRKELFDHFIESGNVDLAKRKFSQLKSDYFTEAIFTEVAWKHFKSVDVMTQLVDLIKDLDDRTQALSQVYRNAKMYSRFRIEKNATLLLIEAEVIKVQDMIAKGQFITYIQEEKLKKMFVELEAKTEQIASQFLDYPDEDEAKELEHLTVTLGKLPPSLITKIGNIISKARYKQQRRFVNLLAVVPNYNKVYALDVMVESGMKGLQFSILWTLDHMGQTVGEFSGHLNQSYVDKVRGKILANVKSAMKCKDKFKIVNQNGKCVQTTLTEHKIESYRKTKKFHKVLASSSCTTFRLSSAAATNDLFSIVSDSGRRLTITDTDFSSRGVYVGNEPSSGSTEANGKWMIEPVGDGVEYFYIRTYKSINTIPIIHELWTDSRKNEEYVLAAWEGTLVRTDQERLKWRIECN